MHLREVSRKINISYSALRYHLDFLKKQGLIITKSNRRYTRYYVTQKVGRRDKEIISLLREEIPRKIILLLLCPGPGDIYKYNPEEELRKSKSYLKTYSKRELVNLTRYWEKPLDKLFLLKKHRSTIDFPLEKLLDAGIVEKVQVGKEIKYRLKDEYMMYAFLITYSSTLSYRLIDIRVGVFKDWIVEHMDSLIDGIFEIFPHPYHA